MAKIVPKPPVPKKLPPVVKAVGRPVAPADVDTYGRRKRILDRSYQIRTIVKAWKDQQAQDRKLRQRYATWLISALGIQTLVVNVVFILLGCNVLEAEPWTARLFITSVFAEITALVLIVAKYLFAPPSDKILGILEPAKPRKQ